MENDSPSQQDNIFDNVDFSTPDGGDISDRKIFESAVQVKQYNLV